MASATVDSMSTAAISRSQSSNTLISTSSGWTTPGRTRPNQTGLTHYAHGGAVVKKNWRQVLGVGYWVLGVGQSEISKILGLRFSLRAPRSLRDLGVLRC